MNKFVVEVFVSKKSGKKCAALIVDFGYRKAFLTFDSNIIAECLQCSVKEVFDLECGVYEI